MSPMPPRLDRAGGSSWMAPSFMIPTPGFDSRGASPQSHGSQSVLHTLSDGAFSQDSPAVDPDVLHASQLLDAPPPTQDTQPDVASTLTQELGPRQRRPTQRYTPSAYDHPPPPPSINDDDLLASARRAKHTRAMRKARGRGRG
uniref:Uncharacterized protein n=1 Tax=Arundo donax TaxID=35708 RepID=A0A0A9GZB2_ARUDO